MCVWAIRVIVTHDSAGILLDLHVMPEMFAATDQ